MSWNVRDEEWVTEPTGVPAAGPLDSLDGQVFAATAATPVVTSPPPPPPPVSAPEEVTELPPPPPSAAFEQHERPSYESGSFVADPPAAEAAPAAPSSTPDFHIPTLAFGVSAPPPEPSQVVPTAPVEPAPPSEPSGLVIPTLSRMKWVPAPSAQPEVPASVASAVYDDETSQPSPPAREPGMPEVLEQVDSSELELVPVEDVDDEEPVREDPAQEVDFVIPTLAQAPPPPTIVIPTLTRASDDDEEVYPPPPPSPAEVEELEEVEEEVEELEEVQAQPPPAPSSEDSKPRTPPPDAKPQQKRRKAWYDDVFAEHFTFLFPQTWEETAQRDAQFIHDQLGLSEGGTVLDVGCGDGRHVIELTKLGLNVTGLDNSLAMLLAAAQHKEASGLEDKRVTFIHGDMRRLPRDREFEAVMCVGTTFGYFEEEQNRHCLQEMFDRLAPGGRLLLHVFNRDFVAPHLPSRSWWQGRRCMVIDEAEMNFFANRLRVHRTIIFDDGRQYEHFMFMRAYTVQDLGKAMSQLGLRVVEVSGSRDTRARFYGSASPDIWMVAERK